MKVGLVGLALLTHLIMPASPAARAGAWYAVVDFWMDQNGVDHSEIRALTDTNTECVRLMLQGIGYCIELPRHPRAAHPIDHAFGKPESRH